MFAPATLLPLTLDVFADIACPWCHVGERHLATALAGLLEDQPGRVVVRRWHPFQLQPGLPERGEAWPAFAARKFGSPEQAASAFQHAARAGAAAGIAFDFARMPVAPNTERAHRLVLAGSSGTADRAFDVAHRLFRAYFEEAEDITDPDTLVRLGVDAGLDESDARAALTDDTLAARVAAAMGTAQRLGITGVPFVLVGQRVGVSGAQPPGVLRQAIDKADDLEGEALREARNQA